MFAVLDTNVLISALMNEQSVSAKALVLAMRHFTLLASNETWDELQRKVYSPKFNAFWDEEARIVFLTLLASRTVFVHTTSQITACRDVDDNKFLNLAVDGGAHLMISGDADLRVLNPFQSIAILSPADFLQRMG
jgi:putative PIN family toxin of toxin-antitoxin system